MWTLRIDFKVTHYKKKLCVRWQILTRPTADHFALCTTIKSLFCTLKTNFTHQLLLKKKKKKSLRFQELNNNKTQSRVLTKAESKKQGPGPTCVHGSWPSLLTGALQSISIPACPPSCLPQAPPPQVACCKHFWSVRHHFASHFLCWFSFTIINVFQIQ